MAIHEPETLFYAPVEPTHLKREREKARQLRQSQWWRQQLGRCRCYHCQEVFAASELTMDHLVPLARGGRSVKTNVVVSCKPCNSKKGHKTRAELAMHGISSIND